MKNCQDFNKQKRNKAKVANKQKVSETQAKTATTLVATMNKKGCIWGAGGNVNRLGFLKSARGGGSPMQPDISAAMARSSSLDRDLYAANHALLTFAIANFFHAPIIDDNIVESNPFLKLLECARQVGQAYKCPNCHDIGGSSQCKFQQLPEGEPLGGNPGCGHIWSRCHGGLGND